MLRRMRRGFTLLELLIVIGILVVLAVAAVPALMNRNTQAKIKLTTSQIQANGTVGGVLKQFYLDFNRYPTTEEWNAGILQTKPSDDETAKKWGGPYIEGNVEDAWGNKFQYVCDDGRSAPNNKEGYDLSSSGPNGKHGDDDDIVNWTKEK